MTDLNSYGVRAESTRKLQAPSVREKPLRVLVPARPANRVGVSPRRRMAPAYERLLHVLAPFGVTKLKSDDVPGYAYDAYHSGRITARQARVLGCVLQNAGAGVKGESIRKTARSRQRSGAAKLARRAGR